MGTMGKVGLVAAIIAVICLIIWAVKSSTDKKDTVTGVSNKKIENAAIASGVTKPVAQAIAAAPDSTSAALRMGISPVAAVSIANGIPTSKEVPMCKYTYTYRNENNEIMTGTEWKPCPGGVSTASKARMASPVISDIASVQAGGGGICYVKIEFPDGTVKLQEVACSTIRDKVSKI